MNAVAYSPDGAKIASTSADRSVRLRTAVVSCAFSPTGKYLLTASNYGERKIKLWYTDMPHMAEKQQVGFRIVWEATGVMRLITVKYEPKAGFFSDVKAAQAEVDAEDVADAAWAQEHPHDGLPQGKLRFPFAMRPSTLGYPYCNGRLCCAKARWPTTTTTTRGRRRWRRRNSSGRRWSCPTRRSREASASA